MGCGEWGLELHVTSLGASRWVNNKLQLQAIYLGQQRKLFKHSISDLSPERERYEVPSRGGRQREAHFLMKSKYEVYIQ